MATITDADAKEVGVKKEVYQRWNDVMQALWTAAITTFGVAQDDKYFPIQGENEIFIGTRFKINASICNDSFIEANLFDGEMQIAEIRYEGISVTTICICLFTLINDLNRVKS